MLKEHFSLPFYLYPSTTAQQGTKLDRNEIIHGAI
jgi:hypothetical protein